MAGMNHDGVTKVLVQQIEEGIKAINLANETLLESDSGTSVREIDKALKAGENLPENITALWKVAEENYKAYRESVEAARNTYRTEILGEDAKEETGDVDKEQVKEVRKVVMDALTFLIAYSTQNGKKEFVDWANSLAVPQVGRQGSSTAGAKKPRVFVKIEDVVYDSFSLAAVALSTKDAKVTAGDLAEAWNAAGGEEGEFIFGDKAILVSYKPKKSDA